ncbi:hypothetical protein MBLNU230_g5039t1 [Neophaeotheca triangularis]
MTQDSINSTMTLPSTRPSRISLGDTNQDLTSTPSPRSPSLSSLQAAAAINASMQRHSPPHQPRSCERRRSSLLHNLSINNPSLPSPGEMATTSNNTSVTGSPNHERPHHYGHTADPNHHRQPSLGELHQDLENEQEAQVNRLLYMIRSQQQEIAALQAGQRHKTTTAPANDPASPTPLTPDPSTSQTLPLPPPASPQTYFNRPNSLSHPHSPSHTTLPPHFTDSLHHTTNPRDETAFHQAETQTMIRENQMLRARIRELERQVLATREQGQNGHSPLLQHSPLAETTEGGIKAAV